MLKICLDLIKQLLTLLVYNSIIFSMLALSNNKGIGVSGIRVTEDGSLLLRFYNRTDEMKITNITLPVDIAKAAYVDLNQNEQAPIMMQDTHTMVFSIEPYATQTIKVTLDR